MSNPNLIIFTGRLLPKSETFILSQGECLHNFTSHYVGARLVQGLILPPERMIIINQGNLFGSAKEIIFKFFGFAPKFYKQVKQLLPVLIHAHFGVCGALALPLARSLQIPLIVTFHGLDATMTDEYARRDSISTRIYLKRREALKQETRLFIAVSEFIKAELVKKGFPSDRILVHYIGVDTELFKVDPKVNRESIVLFVGRLVEKKGCEYLIQAMAKVQSVLPDVELVIIGEGPLRLELEALASKLLHRYQFLGFQPSDIVKSWMNRAQLLAAPSITATQGDSEGLPIVILEAQAMGVPVISTFHAGIPEAVIHGKTGFLAAERDSQALAEYTLQLLKDPKQWQHFSLQARKNMQINFDKSKQNKILEEIYEAVLKDELSIMIGNSKKLN
ncbi:glycosyltransferase [Halotia branconii]|uniref:Glycosyltransferase n=1 Tax=Halotia branconii CENA392 TaxID=1539056 RepID=A0AAJ6NVY0_9CYAN|nr:glycosyltransferase [Halotia branconii]WGV27602.1 glycosyltransferase [Halotia branconii CENA392]